MNQYVGRMALVNTRPHILDGEALGGASMRGIIRNNSIFFTEAQFIEIQDELGHIYIINMEEVSFINISPMDDR